MVTVLTACLSVALSQSPAPHDHGNHHGAHAGHHAPRMGTHGMVVFGGGKGAVFLSHIPMFRRPHDLQLVLRVTLAHPSWKGKGAPSFDGQGHTLQPEELDLSALADGRRKAFRGTIFRGNFEAGGEAAWRDVAVSVESVLVAMGLSEDGPAAPALSYWLVSAPGQSYLVHLISRPPDFDQVLTARGGEGKGAAAATRAQLLFRPDGAAHRLKAGEQVALAMDGDPRRGVVVTVGRELSYLVGPELVPEAKR